MDVPSRNQVKKAGSQIRRFMRNEESDLEVFNSALDTMDAWRKAHSIPLVSANNGLRSRVKTVGISAEVTQRLKRAHTIIDKLTREPSLDLSRMQDIGGCRAVVDSIEDLRRLQGRVQMLDVRRVSDYIDQPRVSGYRGVHIVATYQDRDVEIQLRTRSMHAWALSAEEYSRRADQNFKQDGSHPIQLFLCVASQIMALAETGQDVPQGLLNLHRQRRLEAQPYLTGEKTI